MNDIYKLITNFFTNYMIGERGFSNNTVKSYRDTFVLYFNFLIENKINLFKNNNLFTQIYVLDFLKHLEDSGSSISTINQRLAAIKSFCNYAIRYKPESFNDIIQIKKLMPKKTIENKIDYLTKDEIKSLIESINSVTELKDLAIISLLYETGARVQELIDLKVNDLYLGTPSTIILHGKGRKIRKIPINDRCKKILYEYIKKYKIDDYLFINNSHNKYTRAGISYIISKYVDRAREKDKLLFRIKVHPHVLRHSKAMHMLENGVNLIYIRDFLGHSSVTTTEIYAKCNPELKRKHLETVTLKIESNINNNIMDSKDELIEWLRQNI